MRHSLVVFFFILSAPLLAPSLALAGSQEYTVPSNQNNCGWAITNSSCVTPPSYAFTVPNYGTLTVTVAGAGGGGAAGTDEESRDGHDGPSGGDSSFNGIVIGEGGEGGMWDWGPICRDGEPGEGAGGDSNISGGGGVGGHKGPKCGNESFDPYGDGGPGGKAVKTYAQGELTPGSSIPIVVGAGGAGTGESVGSNSPDPSGGGYGFSATPGAGMGESGSVTITWTDAVSSSSAPSCSVTFDQNPIESGGHTTIHWTSSDATLFYINNMGYVGASGSAQVSPSQTTDYSGSVSGTGGEGNCAGVLTVGGSTTPDGSDGSDDGSCPLGYTLVDGSCVFAECPTGYTLVDGSCVFTECPTGYTLVDGSCVFTECPTGYTLVDGSCVFTECPTGYTLQNGSCVATCPVGSFCQGQDLYYRTGTQTGNSCDATLTSRCSYRCENGACVGPPPPSGSITAQPSLLRQSETTTVSWSAENVVSCSVRGSNADDWSGTSGTKTSTPILAQTVYTLSCEGEDGSAFSRSATVNIIPAFEER